MQLSIRSTCSSLAQPGLKSTKVKALIKYKVKNHAYSRSWPFGPSGADSMCTRGTCSHFYKWGQRGHGGSVSRRTANKKLTKLYSPSRKRSPKRLIVPLEPKKVEGHDQKNFPGALRRTGGPSSHFRSRRVPPLSNSFRRHCSSPRYTLTHHPFS